MVSESGVHYCLSKMNLLRIFPGTDRSIIPLYFLHSCRSPFFGSLTRHPSFHFVGISSLSHIFPVILCSISVEVSTSALIASTGLRPGRQLSLSSGDEWLSRSLPCLVFRSLPGVLLLLVGSLVGSLVLVGQCCFMFSWAASLARLSMLVCSTV